MLLILNKNHSQIAQEYSPFRFCVICVLHCNPNPFCTSSVGLLVALRQMTSEEFERLLELPGGLARRRGGVRSMEGLYLRDRRGILSPEEQAEVDSLQFHLEGYKTTTSPIGRSASLRKVYEILQNGHFAKRDYFHLPSLANFWKNYESLAENYHSLTNESIFWFYAIAILVLFKDTKSRDIYLPSYSVIIIEGIIQCLLLEPKSSSRNDSEEPMVTPFRPINSHSNNFGRKRKFSSNQLASVEITLVETERSGFGSKRKLKGTDLRSERPDLETHTQLAVCIKCDENNAIFSIWSAFAELLQVDIESQRYSSDDLSLLSTFIINRYLNFLISIDVINGSQECDSSSQLQEILNFLRTSGVLQRASATVIRLIKQLRGRDPDYRESFNLWNILGILESACFQNISNQVRMCIIISHLASEISHRHHR